MKLFALITASLMMAAGGAYYLSSGSTSCSKRCGAGAPAVAEVGGCCDPSHADKPVCCLNPCPACSADCLTCCDTCETCCSAGLQAAVSAKPAAAAFSCCGASKATAVAKADCCAPGADCCIAACCFGAEQAVAKTADEECCAICTSPARVATTAVMAGVGVK